MPEDISTNTIQKSDKVVVVDNKTDICKNKNNLLIGISRNVDLRVSPSTKSKRVKRVHKNYIIPFIKMANEDWYEICDGSYVHKNEVSEISLKNAKKKLSWNQKK